MLRRSISDLCGADHRGDAGLIARWCAKKTPDLFRSWLESPHIRIFVRDGTNGIVCVGAIATDGCVLLNYVDPSARRQGHSKAMLRHMETVLHRMGIVEARLESTVTALGFYRAAGWRDFGPCKKMFGLIAHPMVKRLQISPGRTHGT